MTHPARKGRLLVAVAAATVLALCGGTLAAAQDTATAYTLTARTDAGGAELTGGNQGFSVESADFAHGYLTPSLLAQRLRTLGPGQLRLGGYSMDLVWPAFGEYADTPAPDWAIGGTVDQADLDGLAELLRQTGWRVTLGAPLKSVLNGSVAMDQVVAEVTAARATLGDALVAVELGNEYDHVTGLTAAEYYAKLKDYHAALNAAGVGADVRMAGPSANTSTSNKRLEDFVTAVLADPVEPDRTLAELTSHWYPTSHCGSNSTTIPTLMSAATHTKTRAKLTGVRAATDRLRAPVPTVINESNTTSCSGQSGVSDSYATALWSLDYLMQTAQSGVDRLDFHTSTSALCGDLQPRDSPYYPISYRFYAAFCATDEAALEADQLAAAPLYYGIWAFRQVPAGRFLDLDLPDTALGQLRAYAVAGATGQLTLVLVNVHDPAAADSTDAQVTVRLPSWYRTGSAVTLASSAPGGIATTDPGGITLGGRQVTPAGAATGAPQATPVEVDGTTTTVTVRPGTARIVTLSR